MRNGAVSTRSVLCLASGNQAPPPAAAIGLQRQPDGKRVPRLQSVDDLRVHAVTEARRHRGCRQHPVMDEVDAPLAGTIRRIRRPDRIGKPRPQRRVADPQHIPALSRDDGDLRRHAGLEQQLVVIHRNDRFVMDDVVLDDGRIPHLNDRPAELAAASKVAGSIRAMTCPRRTVLLKSAVAWSTMPETWLPTITVCSGGMDPWAITRCEAPPYSTVSTCSGGNPRPPAARCETPYHTARTRIGMMRRNNLPGFINKRPEGARYMTNQLRTRRYDNDDCMAVPKGRRSPQQIPPKQFPEGGDR